ncbi:MAG: hypothetical protein N2559_17865, partial [Anaerolineae bacterium]|nr:hypothetical protein [Anaerolineae bacterium]
RRYGANFQNCGGETWLTVINLPVANGKLFNSLRCGCSRWWLLLMDAWKKKELRALAQELAKASVRGNALAREVMFSVGMNFDEVWPAYQRDARNALEGLRDVRALLDQKVSSTDAAGFKDAVLSLGVQIIEKSSEGAFLGLFGKKDKRKEKIVWGLAAVVLGLRPADRESV